MDNLLQALLTLLSLLAAGVQLNSTFYNALYQLTCIGVKLLFEQSATITMSHAFLFTPAGTCPVYMSGHLICVFMECRFGWGLELIRNQSACVDRYCVSLKTEHYYGCGVR